MSLPSSPKSGMPVSEAATTIISRNYVVLESLKLRVVNYHALAAKIAPEVEELTGRRAKVETIVVAIKRFSDGLGEAKFGEMSANLRGSKLNLAGGVVEITVGGTASQVRQILQDVLELEDKFSGLPYVFRLINSVKIIAEVEDAKRLEDALRGRYEISLERNAATITIRLSPSAQKVPGIASFITELLYRNGVSILDAFLSNEDIILMVQERSGPRAYQVLAQEISG